MNEKEREITTVFGRKLRLLREQYDCSQEQLAEYLGCSQETIQKMERGVQSVKYWRLILICDRFNVSLDYLLRDFDASDLQTVPSYVVKLFQDADETEFEVLSRHMLNASQTIRLIRSLKEKIPPSDPEDS